MLSFTNAGLDMRTNAVACILHSQVHGMMTEAMSQGSLSWIDKLNDSAGFHEEKNEVTAE